MVNFNNYAISNTFFFMNSPVSEDLLDSFFHYVNVLDEQKITQFQLPNFNNINPNPEVLFKKISETLEILKTKKLSNELTYKVAKILRNINYQCLSTNPAFFKNCPYSLLQQLHELSKCFEESSMTFEFLMNMQIIRDSMEGNGECNTVFENICERALKGLLKFEERDRIDLIEKTRFLANEKFKESENLQYLKIQNAFDFALDFLSKETYQKYQPTKSSFNLMPNAFLNKENSLASTTSKNQYGILRQHNTVSNSTRFSSPLPLEAANLPIPNFKQMNLLQEINENPNDLDNYLSLQRH